MREGMDAQRQYLERIVKMQLPHRVMASLEWARVSKRADKLLEKFDRADLALAKRFRTALLGDDSVLFSSAVEELLDSGLSVSFICDHLIEPVMSQMGTKWCEDSADFASLTIIGARLQSLVGRLIDVNGLPASGLSYNRRITLGCLPGSDHRLGVMAARAVLLEKGWDVYTTESLECDDDYFELLSDLPITHAGFSVDTTQQLDCVARLISRARQTAGDPDIQIVLGGCILQSHADLFRTLDVDILATSIHI